MITLVALNDTKCPDDFIASRGDSRREKTHSHSSTFLILSLKIGVQIKAEHPGWREERIRKLQGISINANRKVEKEQKLSQRKECTRIFLFFLLHLRISTRLSSDRLAI